MTGAAIANFGNSTLSNDYPGLSTNNATKGDIIARSVPSNFIIKAYKLKIEENLVPKDLSLSKMA